MRIVIAEDLVLLRQSLVRMLRGEGVDVVAEVGDAGALLSAVVEHRPDLVVVDVRMPPGFTDEGARAALVLRDRFPELAVVVLSHIIDPTVALTLAASGAERFGYLLKDRILELDGFVDMLRHVAEGGTAIDPDVVTFLLNEAGPGRLGVLSPREREVLGLLAQGLSNQAISARLVVSERTVDAHLRAVFTKLGLHPDQVHNRRVLAAIRWLGEQSTTT